MPELSVERCPACGGSFECGAAAADCWCRRHAVDDATLARLARSYRGCLCPSCLGRAAELPKAARA